MRRLALLSLWVSLACACHARGARREALLFTLEDPRGDDVGDGDLRYPQRPDMGPGSLDLLSLSARAERGGTIFEATLARPIAMPARGHTVDPSGTTQADIARYGFYTFNLDVYVDTDGVAGSGRTDTLPGRQLTLAPRSAWEKVILLTPRPYEARDVLRKLWAQGAREAFQKEHGGVSEANARTLDEQVERALAERVFFPTRIRVSGSRVFFFVPEDFLGGTAQPTWGYAVAVTGASLQRRVELPAFLGGSAEAREGLMLLGIRPGGGSVHFGGGRLGDPGQSPVVDLMVPEGVQQREVLGPKPLPWPAVVPAVPSSPLPQAPDAGGPTGEGGAPGSGGL
ncbi:MAG TPA: glucodextranase DOMON-like domain-containing protein [Archangium sp.]|uniref:glucodextranase DOMON-like domain-containing protein n=1 Tax=Archangium sp. TaxID=1872627 RepID=UPI002ED87B8A